MKRSKPAHASRKKTAPPAIFVSTWKPIGEPAKPVESTSVHRVKIEESIPHWNTGPSVVLMMPPAPSTRSLTSPWSRPFPIGGTRKNASRETVVPATARPRVGHIVENSSPTLATSTRWAASAQ